MKSLQSLSKSKGLWPLLIVMSLALLAFIVIVVTQANLLRQQLAPAASTAVITFHPEALALVWTEGKVRYRVDFRAGVMTDGTTSLPLTFQDWTVALPILSGLPEYCRISVEWFQQGGKPRRELPHRRQRPERDPEVLPPIKEQKL